MFKRLIFKILIVSSVLPCFIFAMEDQNGPKEKALKILNISEPLDSADIKKLHTFANALLWQEEFNLNLESLIISAERYINANAEILKLVQKADFISPQSEFDASISFSNIDSPYVTAVILRDKKLIEKKYNFTKQDEALAQRLKNSSDEKIQLIGEIKENQIIVDKTEPLIIDIFAQIAKQLSTLEIYYEEIFDPLKEKLKNYLESTRIILLIAPNWFAKSKIEQETAIEDTAALMKKIKSAKSIFEKYKNSSTKYDLPELYSEIREILNNYVKQTGEDQFLLHTNLNGTLMDLPPSFNEITSFRTQKIIEKSIEETKKPRKKIKKSKPKKKPAKKSKQLELDPEKPEEIRITPEEQTTVEWFNKNFPAIDGSFIESMDDYKITIGDPKNNAQVILFRKSQDDEKIISPPLNYDSRVERWFENPEQALKIGSYTKKYKSKPRLKEFELRHNFAQIADAFLDKEGTAAEHVDKYGRVIPVKLLAGELRIFHPAGNVKKISGIFSYGKIPGEDKYYHRYFSDKEYKDIINEYYANSKWEVEFPPLGK